ncbi:MAG: exodeoxyribonuclease VII small subunit [Candidatus Methylacidiphilales bacterium]
MAKKVSADDSMTFEESMERLEAIVEEMESGEMPLGEILKRYEEGMSYLKNCDAQLVEAETKIRKWTEGGLGTVSPHDVDVED